MVEVGAGVVVVGVEEDRRTPGRLRAEEVLQKDLSDRTQSGRVSVDPAE